MEGVKCTHPEGSGSQQWPEISPLKSTLGLGSSVLGTVGSTM